MGRHAAGDLIGCPRRAASGTDPSEETTAVGRIRELLWPLPSPAFDPAFRNR